VAGIPIAFLPAVLTQPAPRSTRVLLVDDDSAVLETLADIFDVWGCAVELATSGEAAIDRIRTDPPDLVLMDVKMSGMNGVEAMRSMRSVAPRLPIVLMTAYAPPALVDEAEATVGVLRKPLDLDLVLSLVRASARRAALGEWMRAHRALWLP
jgi:CheY-like chemotaxis protein